MKKKGKTTTRKRGAQPGNKNNLRHGFYAKLFTVEENKRLDAQETIDVQAEISLLRVYIDRLSKQLDFTAIERTDNNGNTTRDDHYLRALNTLSQMTQSLGTLTRTHYLIRGKSGDVSDAIMRALEEIRLEMGL